MAHVERVSVEGFKTIAELSVEPGQFTVVTGRNNSGKTSLLEAVRLGCEPETMLEFQRGADSPFVSNSQSGVRDIVNRHNDQVTVQTIIDDRLEELEIQTVSEEKARETFARVIADGIEQRYEGEGTLSEAIHKNQDVNSQHPGPELTEQIRKHVRWGNLEASNHLVKISKDEEKYSIIDARRTAYNLERNFVLEKLTSWLDNDELKNIGVEVTEGESGDRPAYRYSSTEFDTLPDGTLPSHLPTKFVTHGTTVDADDDDPVKTDDIGDFLREKGILEDLKTFTLDDLIFDPDDGEKYAVPFDQMGDGFRAIVALLWELLDDDLPEVVFLEEPTTHMHPGYVREVVYFLIQLAMEEDVQLFVTTHSNDFLNDLFAENLREEEVAFLEEEFKLFQMQDGGAKTLDYREAEESLEELMLDLRGL